LLIAGIVFFGCSGRQMKGSRCDADAACASPGVDASSGGGAGNAAGGNGSLGGAGNMGGNGSLGGGAGSQAGGSGGGAGDVGGSGMPVAGTMGNGATGGTGGAGGTGNAGGSGDAGGAGGTGGVGGTGGTGGKICPDGTFDHDNNPSTLCKGWSRCTAGQYIATEGTDTKDRVCAVCGAGTFSNTSNARMCLPFTDCAANFYVSQPGSTTADQKCSACPNLQFTGYICLPAGSCLFAGACQPGTVQTVAASGTAPAMCHACGLGDYCAGGLSPQVRCADGTWDHDANPATCCSTWATCPAGKYVSRPGTASTDRECSSCAAGSFSRFPDAPKCEPWTVCPPASSKWPQAGVATAGTATSDVVCADPYYRFGSEGDDTLTDVTVDGSGNVYVAGITYGALEGPNAGLSDAFVRKLDPSGATLWTRQFGTSSDDQAFGVAVDGSGNVYVVGVTYGALEVANGGVGDAFVRKLDPSGATLWTQQLATPRGEAATAVALDGSGAIFIAGYSYGNSQSSGEAFVRKLDAAGGATTWAQQFGGPDEDEALGVAVDGSGNVYVGGYTYGGIAGGSSTGLRDVFVRKFNPAGATAWTRQIGSPVDHDEIGDVRVDGNGNVYVAGTTSAALGGTNEGLTDAFVRKLDPSGATLWTRQVGTTGNDSCAALAVDGGGNVYVVGTTNSAFGSTNEGETDVFVRKLDPSGATQWTQQVGTSTSDWAQGATVDEGRNVYVVGSKGTQLSDAFILYIPAQ